MRSGQLSLDPISDAHWWSGWNWSLALILLPLSRLTFFNPSHIRPYSLTNTHLNLTSSIMRILFLLVILLLCASCGWCDTSSPSSASVGVNEAESEWAILTQPLSKEVLQTQSTPTSTEHVDETNSNPASAPLSSVTPTNEKEDKPTPSQPAKEENHSQPTSTSPEDVNTLTKDGNSQSLLDKGPVNGWWWWRPRWLKLAIESWFVTCPIPFVQFMNWRLLKRVATLIQWHARCGLYYLSPSCHAYAFAVYWSLTSNKQRNSDDWAFEESDSVGPSMSYRSNLSKLYHPFIVPFFLPYGISSLWSFLGRWVCAIAWRAGSAVCLEEEPNINHSSTQSALNKGNRLTSTVL